MSPVLGANEKAFGEVQVLEPAAHLQLSAAMLCAVHHDAASTARWSTLPHLARSTVSRSNPGLSASIETRYILPSQAEQFSGSSWEIDTGACRPVTREHKLSVTDYCRDWSGDVIP
jgi:hypothetical protein